MAQATLLGLCNDNVVTVLTPSSTIESPLGPVDASINGSGTITFGTPIQLAIPSDALYIVFGTITLPTLSVTPITISIGSFIWSQAITGVTKVPFQTICRGPPALLITGASGTASYTYTATVLR